MNDAPFPLDNETKVGLILTTRQLRCLAMAADCYMRLGLGQTKVIAGMIRDGAIPTRKENSSLHDFSVKANQAESLCESLGTVLGYPSNSSLGINNPRVPEDARRAHELAEQFQDFLGGRHVKYDRTLLQLTDDPDISIAPVAGSGGTVPTDPSRSAERAGPESESGLDKGGLSLLLSAASEALSSIHAIAKEALSSHETAETKGREALDEISKVADRFRKLGDVAKTAVEHGKTIRDISRAAVKCESTVRHLGGKASGAVDKLWSAWKDATKDDDHTPKP